VSGRNNHAFTFAGPATIEAISALTRLLARRAALDMFAELGPTGLNFPLSLPASNSADLEAYSAGFMSSQTRDPIDD
jgi:hypothetical protein